MGFRDAFKFPLELVCGKIMDANFNMVADFVVNLKEEGMQEVVDIINGISPPTGNKQAEIDGEFITSKGRQVLLMRGWGHLTGGGGLNLKEAEAITIQSAMQQFIVDKLNG